MGHVSTSNPFNRVTDEIFEGITRVDNILVEASSMEQMEERLMQVLQQAKENNVKIS